MPDLGCQANEGIVIITSEMINTYFRVDDILRMDIAWYLFLFYRPAGGLVQQLIDWLFYIQYATLL